ncbi:MAG TPA: GIY-YIG nuclease family protein [Thermoguttaceae bacterium]
MISKTQLRRQVVLAWQPYRQFTWENIHTYTPIQAGVYKLAVHTTDGKLTVFYVGQSTNLDTRLKEHLGQGEPNQCLRSMIERYRCSFSFAMIPLAQDRDAAERALILHFRPSCNNAMPTGPDCYVSPLTT